MVDLESLCAPAPGPEPCGPNLEYAPDFLEIEAAARGVPEQRMGALFHAGVPPDWQKVETLASSLLIRSKDLRIAMYLARAALHLHGLTGLGRAMELIAGLLDRFGAQLHPQPSEPGEWPPPQVLALKADGSAGLLSDLRELAKAFPEHLLTGQGAAVVADTRERGQSSDSLGKSRWNIARRHEYAHDPETRSSLHENLQACLNWTQRVDELIWDRVGGGEFWRPMLGLIEYLKLLRHDARRAIAVEDTADGFANELVVRPAFHTIAARGARSAERDPVPDALPSLDLDALLAPISAEEPCGPDLEYDPAFFQLEHAMAGIPERWSGRDVVPAQSPDWALVHTMARTLLSRTKDVRVAVALTRAGTRTNGIEGAAEGLRLIDRLLSEQWNHVHPRLESGEDIPALGRINALLALNAPEGLLGDLRSAAWEELEHQVVGATNKRLAAGEDDGAAAVSGEGSTVPAANKAIRSPALARHIQQAVDAVDSIRTTIEVRIGDEASRLDKLGAVRRLLQYLRDLMPASDTDKPRDSADGELQSPPPAADGHRADVIESEAIEVLEALSAWIDQAGFDPSQVCRRAERLSATHFVRIVEALTPENAQHAVAFLGYPMH